MVWLRKDVISYPLRYQQVMISSSVPRFRMHKAQRASEVVSPCILPMLKFPSTSGTSATSRSRSLRPVPPHDTSSTSWCLLVHPADISIRRLSNLHWTRHKESHSFVYPSDSTPAALEYKRNEYVARGCTSEFTLTTIDMQMKVQHRMKMYSCSI